MSAIAYNGEIYRTGKPGDMIGASALADGAHGLVPAPSIGDENKVLKGDGTWGEASSSGHTILSKLGTPMNARANLSFGNANVTDDETNDVTKVDIQNIEPITQEAYNQLTQAEKNAHPWFITNATSFGGVYLFQTVALMEAAVQAGTVPAGAVMMTGVDTPYVPEAEDVVYDNTESELEATNAQNAIDEIVATVKDIDSISLKNNVNGQSINSSTNYNRFTIGVDESPNGLVELRCDSEGGNISIKKGDIHIEIDTNNLNTIDTGYARLYLYNPSSGSGSLKIFRFNQNGSFTDGNNISTGLESVTYTPVDDSRFTPSQVLVYMRSGIVFYKIVLQSQSSAWSGGWIKVGQFSKTLPNVSYQPIYNGANAIIIGYCQIYTNGELLVYSPHITAGVLPVMSGSFVCA